MTGFGYVECQLGRDLGYAIERAEAESDGSALARITSKQEIAIEYARATIKLSGQMPLVREEPNLDERFGGIWDLHGVRRQTKHFSDYVRVGKASNPTSELDEYFFSRVVENRDELWRRRLPLPLRLGELVLEKKPAQTSGIIAIQTAVGDKMGHIISTGDYNDEQVTLEAFDFQDTDKVAQLDKFLVALHEIVSVPPSVIRERLASSNPLI